ncbi:ATP-dependent RNA helicase mrh4, mitochondrial [Thermoascus aurantiacus ATCC 26904]
MRLPAYRPVGLLGRSMPPALRLRPAAPAWQQTSRSMASALRRKPSRMALSPHVAKDTLKPKKKKSPDVAGPFAGMNRTHADIREEDRPQAKDSDKEESPLYKALKMQTALAPVTYRHRNAVKAKIADITSFDMFQLLPVVRDSIFTQALPGLVDVTPSPIQRLAIPALLETGTKDKPKKKDDDEPGYDQFLLAAETGSGKTLAYLVPVIDSVKRLELAEKEAEEKERLEQEKAEGEKKQKSQNKVFEIEPPELSAPHETAGRPRAIILLPTSELVNQVGKVVKAFSHTVKYRSGFIHSGFTARKIRNIVFNPNGIDILVATPHLLASIVRKDPNILSRVTHLVVDEADSLLDRSFAPATTELIDKSAPSLKQLILCSATIPRSLDSLLRKRYPDIKRLTTPNLHAIPRRVQLGVVDIEKDPYRGNRSLACADVIWSIGKAGDSSEPSAGPYSSILGPKLKKILVFVNEREDAEEVTKFLCSKGIDAACLSRDSDDRRQAEILAEFTIVPPPPSPEDIIMAQKKRRLEDSIPFVLPEQKQEQSPRKLPNTKVLVTTDLGSRGIDTLAVKTVILYDVPHTTIDFIHRLGRVGRMGKRGRGVVLVGKKDRKDIVKEVREAMYRGQALI